MGAAEKSANAIGGKTARACDSCLRRRARWYCLADDAFLCQGCDSSVHSANQLARRHDRVRLETASKGGSSSTDLTNPKFADNTVPAWHHGFTRKARTPRNKKMEPKLLPVDLVPEISNEFDTVMDENELEEHFFFRVPEFDPFEEVMAAGTDNDGEDFIIAGCDLDINELFLPTELDLAGFAADVESLLGKVDEEAVKVKGEVELEDEGDLMSFGIVAAREDDDGAWGGMENRLPLLEEDEKKDIMEEENCEVKKKRMLLRLNYEDVMTAWDCQGSPWTTGVRPDLGAGDSWPDCMDTCGTEVRRSLYGETVGLIRAQSGDTKQGREERVSRYREKRRTRMFSKKIRYQVRKLNAEKRPRMKGRFVKRSINSPSYPITSHLHHDDDEHPSSPRILNHQ